MDVRRLVILGLALVAACDNANEGAIIGPECQAILDVCRPANEAGVTGAAYCVDIGGRGDELDCATDRDGCERLCEDGMPNDA